VIVRKWRRQRKTDQGKSKQVLRELQSLSELNQIFKGAKMKIFRLISMAIMLLLVACAPLQPEAVSMDAGGTAITSDATEEQLAALQQLLQDPEFALEMASWLDAAYYKGQGEPVPDFIAPEDEDAVVEKSVAEEKIAMNLAGFYALEAGLGVLAERTGESPTEILTEIVDGTRADEDMLLMARFANATWKAGQPFRSLERITRDTFIPAAMLSDEELSKDYDQIIAASELLLEKMQGRRRCRRRCSIGDPETIAAGSSVCAGDG
jgi:hypothetical protein